MGEDVEKEKKEDKEDKKEEAKESKDKKNEEKEKKEDEKDSQIVSDSKHSKIEEISEITATGLDAINDDDSWGNYEKRELGIALRNGTIVKSTKNAYKVSNRLGVGEFGYVYQISVLGDDDKGVIYAMKTDCVKPKEDELSIKHELAVLTDANNDNKHANWYMLKLIDQGRTEDFRFSITELGSHNLADILRLMCKNKMHIQTSLYLSQQTHNAMVALHGLNYIHRDIRPHNFCVGLFPKQQRVYITGFGLARKFIDQKNEFLPLREKAPIVGSLKYRSRWSHGGKEMTWKDDYESWVYMCLEFFHKDNITWNRNHSEEEVFALKKSLFTKPDKMKIKVLEPTPTIREFPFVEEFTKGFLVNIMRSILSMSDEFKKDDYADKRFMSHEMESVEGMYKAMTDKFGEFVSRPRKATVEQSNSSTSEKVLKLVWETMEMPKKDAKNQNKLFERTRLEAKRQKILAKKKDIEEKLEAVNQELDEVDGVKEDAPQRDKSRSPDKKKRRSKARKKRENETEEEDDEYYDDEDESEERRRKRKKSKTRQKKSETRSERDERKRSKKKRKRAKKKNHARLSPRTIEERILRVMNMEESPPKDKGKSEKKRNEAMILSPEKMDEKDDQRKDSGRGSGELSSKEGKKDNSDVEKK